MIICGVTSRRCPSAAASASSIARITKKCWSSRVHPEILERQQLPPELKGKGIWKRRYEEINHFEEYLVHNGTLVLKFFLNVSKEEQKQRFLERIDRPEKNWKFSSADAKERERWDEYQAAYEDMLNHTSTEHAPWYVVPADHKWFSRLAVGAVILQTMRELEIGLSHHRRSAPAGIAEGQGNAGK